MKKFFFLLLVLLTAAWFGAWAQVSAQETNQSAQSNSNQIVPRHPRRRRRREIPRRRGIKHSYARAGRSMGRGGKGFGKNISKGKPIKAGREMGQGSAGFGRNVGRGTKGVGRKVAHKTKNAVTPQE